MHLRSLTLITLAISTLHAAPPTATPPTSMAVKKDFKVELLYAVPGETQGSWVAMCVDPKGRLIVSDQYGALYRLTPPPLGETRAPEIEKIPAPIGEAEGLVWAFDSLYVVVCKTEKYASGLYRVTSSKGDDTLDKAELLRALDGSGDHGPHQVLLTPDGHALIVIAGNHTKLTELSGSLVPRVWGEDHLLPRMWDPRGHARDILAPGGCIYRVSPDGKNWTLVSMGYRNQYDAAFNHAGDLFTYDSDMEWDMNTPWYRPTRLCLVTSGSDYGWRSGSGVYPARYAETLAPVLDMGGGSPTAVAFGDGAKFPAKYQGALFLADWSYGKIYAVQLTPDGTGYRAEKEEMIQGQPLPVTDIVVRPQDGAMYFTTGGRKVQSALYRLTYAGADSTEPLGLKATTTTGPRLALESLHGKRDAADIEKAWPALGSADRFLRGAARVILEQNEPASWQERALSERDAQTALTALLALARVGDKALQDRLLRALDALDAKKFTEAQNLEALRIVGFSFIRMGYPDEDTARDVIAKLDPLFPSKSRVLNAELCQLLAYLQAPTLAAKALPLVAGAPSQDEQMEYIKDLRVLKTGWTPELRRAYFSWFQKAANYRGGASFGGFVKQIREDAIALLPPADKTALQPILDAVPPVKTPMEVLAESLGKRTFVKNWTLDELTAAAATLHGRNYENGRKLFAGAGCIACHRFDGEGGAMGPDLTQLGGRFAAHDVLESIIDPNKVVSDQYAPVVFTMTDGSQLTGRVINMNKDQLNVNVDMFDPAQVTPVNAKNVKTIEPSKISLMPPGLLNTLKEDEALDLVAYLLSRGEKDGAAFR